RTFSRSVRFPARRNRDARPCRIDARPPRAGTNPNACPELEGSVDAVKVFEVAAEGGGTRLEEIAHEDQTGFVVEVRRAACGAAEARLPMRGQPRHAEQLAVEDESALRRRAIEPSVGRQREDRARFLMMALEAEADVSLGDERLALARQEVQAAHRLDEIVGAEVAAVAERELAQVLLVVLVGDLRPDGDVVETAQLEVTRHADAGGDLRVVLHLSSRQVRAGHLPGGAPALGETPIERQLAADLHHAAELLAAAVRVTNAGVGQDRFTHRPRERLEPPEIPRLVLGEPGLADGQ